MMLSELNLAEQIAMGTLTAPVSLGGSWLVGLRISGTGVAWRKPGTFVWRPPAVWCSVELARRCAGVPVLLGHPPRDVVRGLEDVQDRFVGVVLLAYVSGENLMGVARIFDRDVAAAIAENRVSTSPACSFPQGSVGRIVLPGGDEMVVEGNPLLMDHLALCERGVWDRSE